MTNAEIEEILIGLDIPADEELFDFARAIEKIVKKEAFEECAVIAEGFDDIKSNNATAVMIAEAIREANK